MQNFEAAEKAMDNMAQSAGNADAEMDIIKESLEYKLNALKETGVGIFQEMFSREDIGAAIDALTGLLSIIGEVTSFLGGLGTIAVGGGIFAFLKEVQSFNTLANAMSLIGNSATISSQSINVLSGSLAKMSTEQIIAKAATLGLSETQVAAALASKGMSNELIAANLVTMGFTVEQTKAALAAIGLSASEIEAATSTEALSAAEAGAITTTSGLTASFKALGLAIKANPIGLIITVIMGAIGAYKKWQQYQEELIRKTKEASKAYTDQASSIDDYKNKIAELKNELAYGNLSEQEAYDKRQQLLSIQDEICDKLGDEASSFNILKDSIDDVNDALDNYNAKAAEKYLTENEAELNKAKKKMEAQRDWGDGVGNTIFSNINTDTNESKNAINRVKSIFKDVFGDDVDFKQLGEGRFSYVLDVDARTAIKGLEEVNVQMSELDKELKRNGLDLNQVLGLDQYDQTWRNSIKTAMSVAQKVVDDFGESYDAAVQASIATNQDYLKLMGDMKKASKDYTNAQASGIESDIQQAYNVMQKFVPQIDEIDNVGVKTFFEDFLESFNEQAEDEIMEINLKTDLKLDDSKWGKQIHENLEKFRDKDGKIKLQDILDVEQAVQGFEADVNSRHIYSEKEQAIRQLRDVSKEYGMTLEELCDILVEENYLIGASGDSSTKALAGLQSQSSGIQTAIETMRSAVSEESENGGLSAETYEDLIALGKDYADCLEWNGQAYGINQKKLKDLNKTLNDSTKAEAELAKANDMIKWRENAAQIMEERAALEAFTDKKSEEYQMRLQQLTALEQENSLLASNIQQYQILISQLDYATSGYKAWIDAQNQPEAGAILDDAISAFEALQEGFETGLTGTPKFEGAMDFLIPDDVIAKGLDAVEKYIYDIRKMFDSENGAQGVQMFMDKAVNAGLAGYDDDGNWKIKPDIDTDDFVEKLHMTRDLVLAFFGKLKDYRIDISFVDEDQTAALLKVQELMDAQRELKDIELKFGIDSQDYKDKALEIQEITNELKQIPEDMRKKIGISIPEQSELDALQQEIEEKFSEGNVDLTARVRIENEDGSFSTLESDWVSKTIGDQEVAIHYTPIIDGEKIDENELNSYLDSIVAGAQSEAEILERDKIENGGKGILLRVKAGFEIDEEDNFDEQANAISDQYANFKQDIENGLHIDPVKFQTKIEALNKSDVQKLIEEYRILFAEVQADPGNLELGNRLAEVRTELTNLQPAAKEAFNIDPSLFEYGMASLSETLNDYKFALAELDELEPNSEGFEEAKKRADDLRKIIESYPDLEIKTNINLETLDEDIRKNDFKLKLEVHIETNMEQASSFMDDLESRAKTLQSTPIPIDADTSAANEKLDAVQQKVDNIDGATASVDVDAAEGEQKILTFQDHINNLKDKIVELSAKTLGEDKIKSLKKAMDDVKNKTVILTAITRNQVINESSGSSGTHQEGEGRASGTMGAERTERVLGGELGQEIVVDPKTGTWHTIGDNGAEFFMLHKGEIVFNADQTKELLRNGMTNSRGKAFLNGTAKVTNPAGKIRKPLYFDDKTNGKDSSKSKSSKSSTSSKSSSSKSSKSSDGAPWEDELKEYQHLRAMELMTDQEYYDKLNNILAQHYNNRAKYLDDYWSLEEEAFELSRSLIDKWLDEKEHQIEIINNSKKDIGVVVNTEELQTALAEYKAELQQAEEKEIDLSKTIYGNIDTNNRQVLNWTEDNLAKYKDALASWDIAVDEIRGSMSTVMGMSKEYGGVEIAFSPMLQTENGAVLLDSYTLVKYITELMNKVGDDFTAEKMLRFDTEGIQIDGMVIKNILADIGETAIKTGEAMNYVGQLGSVQQAQNKYKQAETNSISNNVFDNKKQNYDSQVAIYREMQAKIHEQAEAARAYGLDENSEYIRELQSQWWDYENSIRDLTTDYYDSIAAERENAIMLDENFLEKAIESNNHGDITKYTSKMIEQYKAMQEDVHQQAEYYRSLGYSDTSDEIAELSDKWWEYYDEIKSVTAEAWQQVVDNSHEALDAITGVYDTLKNAAQEFSESGYITVSTFQDIAKLGVENLSYLQDENGMLVINEENIQNVIAARTRQMAVETALNYVQQLRQAQTDKDTAALIRLTTATDIAAKSTWDMVYAQLNFLELESEQYNHALKNINNLRALSDIAITSIGKMDEDLEETIKKQADALEDLLKYVEDMIKQEIKNQVDALKDQVDQYKEIVDLQKKSLDLEKEKDDYTKTIAEKTKELAELQKQLSLLELDDSRESIAKQKELREKMAELSEDLSDKQADHAYDATKDALDDMADAYSKEKDKEIEILENSISSEEKLYRLAIERISTSWGTLYKDLIDYNTEYGNVTNSTIDEVWGTACQAVQEYGDYLTAVIELQKQLKIYESSSSKISYGEDGEENKPSNIVGKVGEYDTSGGDYAKERENIIKKMYNNGQAWGRANQAGNEDEKKRLDEDNIKLGEDLKEYGIYAHRDNTGTWVLEDGTLLFEKYKKYTYHTGGIAGDEPTLKQDELFAKLKKGEAVLTEEQQKPIYQILDFADTMMSRYGKLLQVMSGNDMLSAKIQEQITQSSSEVQNVVENSANSINITVPVQVHTVQKLDEDEIGKLTQTIGDSTIRRINDSFYKRGKVNSRPSSRP